MPKLDLNHWYKIVPFVGCLLVKKSNLSNIKLEVLHSTFFKWSRDWDQNVDFVKKWLHNFCLNLVWTINIREFRFLGGYFLVERSNLANIKPEVLQPTFLKLSRDWYQNTDILKKWLHNFYPKYDLNHRYKGVLFKACLLVKRSNLANIKLGVLQSTVLKLSRG